MMYTQTRYRWSVSRHISRNGWRPAPSRPTAATIRSAAQLQESRPGVRPSPPDPDHAAMPADRAKRSMRVTTRLAPACTKSSSICSSVRPSALFGRRVGCRLPVRRATSRSHLRQPSARSACRCTTRLYFSLETRACPWAATLIRKGLDRENLSSLNAQSSPKATKTCLTASGWGYMQLRLPSTCA